MKTPIIETMYHFCEKLPEVKFNKTVPLSVAEPMEQQHFAGAGAEVFLAWLRLRSRVCKFFKMLQKPKIFHTGTKI
jgi:hypothetical protein